MLIFISLAMIVTIHLVIMLINACLKAKHEVCVLSVWTVSSTTCEEIKQLLDLWEMCDFINTVNKLPFEMPSREIDNILCLLSAIIALGKAQTSFIKPHICILSHNYDDKINYYDTMIKSHRHHWEYFRIKVVWQTYL